MKARSQDISGTRKAEILLVGNELLVGTTRDLNAYWLGGRLALAGISVSRVTVVPDNVGVIATVLREILSRQPDYVFSCGGIGPTFDDETLQGIASGLGRSLQLDATALAWIRERYELGYKAGRLQDKEMTPSRVKMAWIPGGSIPVPNSAGTAPAVKIVSGKTTIFVLPGVPRELQAIFTAEIAPGLRLEGGITFHQVRFKVDGVGESTMAKPVEGIMDGCDPRVWIKSHAKHDGTRYFVEVHVNGYGDHAMARSVGDVAGKVRATIELLGGEVKEIERRE